MMAFDYINGKIKSPSVNLSSLLRAETKTTDCPGNNRSSIIVGKPLLTPWKSAP